MNTLFTLSNSWHNSHWLYEKLAFASDGDAILLLEDAVLAAHSPLTLASFIAKCQAANVSIYLLGNDLELRGIDNKYPDITLVDYLGFVDLLTKYDKQVAW